MGVKNIISLEGTNTLAFYDAELIMDVRSFKVHALGLEVPNTLAYYDAELIMGIRSFIVLVLICMPTSSR
jgi:hypothetical protein